MISPLLDHGASVARWVAQHPPFDPERGFGNCTAIGFTDDDGTLIAGVVFHDWNEAAGIIELSAAADSPKWLTRKSLDLIFRYPFEQLQCQMVFLRTSARNTDRGINRISKAFGFEQITVPRFYGRDEDGILHILTDDQWRAARIAFRPKSR